jgi:hypothetical protein
LGGQVFDAVEAAPQSARSRLPRHQKDSNDQGSCWNSYALISAANGEQACDGRRHAAKKVAGACAAV